MQILGLQRASEMKCFFLVDVLFIVFSKGFFVFFCYFDWSWS